MTMNLPKTVPVKWIRSAKPGDSIVCEGHTSYCRTPLVRLKLNFICNKAWLVPLRGTPPVPVTVITLTSEVEK